MKIIWYSEAWDQYLSWHERAVRQRINALIEDIKRNGHQGIGKPEPLRGDLSGWHSRRIDREHRLVYRLVGEDIEIIQCRYHYGK